VGSGAIWDLTLPTARSVSCVRAIKKPLSDALKKTVDGSGGKVDKRVVVPATQTGDTRE
jgi:hypothetical protein